MKSFDCFVFLGSERILIKYGDLYFENLFDSPWSADKDGDSFCDVANNFLFLIFLSLSKSKMLILEIFGSSSTTPSK